MSAAVLALLDLFTKLEPSIAELLVGWFGRLNSSIAAQSSQAIFVRTSAIVLASFANDTLLTLTEKKIAARQAIINALADLGQEIPSFELIYEIVDLGLDPPAAV